MSSPRGRFFDYQAGFFYINVKNDVDYQKIWGADAGAWYANPTQYSAARRGPGRALPAAAVAGRAEHVVQLADRDAAHQQHERRALRAGQLASDVVVRRDHGRASERRESPEQRQHVHQRQRLRARVEPGVGQRRVARWVQLHQRRRAVGVQLPRAADPGRPDRQQVLWRADHRRRRRGLQLAHERAEATAGRCQGDPRGANRHRVRSTGRPALQSLAAVLRGQPAVQIQRQPEHLRLVAVRREGRASRNS